MNLSDRADLSCEMLTSFLIRGVQMGEVSKLGRLFGLVTHAIWVDSLYFLYMLLLSVTKILASSQPIPYDSLYRHVGLILIFLEDPP
jgi:hypothetical protein